ncbi:MAG: hypothetical protein L3J35_01975 [Bacteroidales bacterium]|nr:hypothetical protein [Bacteroidales bacterium]
MKIKIILLSLLAVFSVSSTAYADSPLTSTHFSKAYEDEAIIIKASKSNGILTPELMNYLIDKQNPVAVKMAVINKLSWDINGKSNTGIFIDYLKKKKLYKNEDKFIKKGKGDVLLCVAYLKVMDNYNDIDDALKYAEYALKKNSKSYTYNIIAALIKAQKAFNSDWCKVFKLTDNVRNNNSLKIDMKVEAITIIFDYMDLYEAECN